MILKLTGVLAAAVALLYGSVLAFGWFLIVYRAQ